ncbi:hypothetical protein [Streptomyces mesophilus]|uniref:hypothetical protein n=1 Tax=Streptomyces mesophilus TaxID=1775132 RepID=UPI003317F96F
MGVCMEVLIVDWGHLRSVPLEQRVQLVETAAFGPNDVYDYNLPKGWTWPESADDRWWARFEFLGRTSYKAHFWSGERWDKLRPFVDLPLRATLDQFAAPLFWGEYNWESLAPGFTPTVESHAGNWPPEAEVMLWLEPHEVARLRDFWTQVEPHVATLREPFELHLAEATGWIKDFDSFAQLVTEWGDVVSRAAERGWAVIGLRC